MSTFSIGIRAATKAGVERLAQATRRSRNILWCDAVESFVELQARQIAHIEEGLADLDAGWVQAHDEIEGLVREFKRRTEGDLRRYCVTPYGADLVRVCKA